MTRPHSTIPSTANVAPEMDTASRINTAEAAPCRNCLAQS
jgi:hypothetical protein